MQDAINKRDLLKTSLLLGALGIGGGTAAIAGEQSTPPADPMPKGGFKLDFPGEGPIPWFKRIFHLYTGPDGLTIAQALPVNAPQGKQVAQLLRRHPYRVTIGGSSAGAGYDFHVANHPTFLIPIFGSMRIELHDGTVHELRHGDIAYAEDCTGKGHISRAGSEGSMMISIQMPKEGCPAVGSSDVTKIWSE